MNALWWLRRFWCGITSHDWAYLIDYGNAKRLCIRCGQAGWQQR